MKKYLLPLILLLAFVLRFYKLVQIPTGFTMDEAAHGYTAYSILKTGKDEWGKFLPINPRSVGDYKLPLYEYLSIPFISLLGLNELSVRLPSAILGVLAVWVTYLFVKELFKDSEAEYLALISSLFLAISPWHIGLSRGAFEMSFPAFLVPLGLWLFLKGKENSKYLSFSALVFGVSLFSCHSNRYFIPFVIGTVLIFDKKEILKNLNKYFLPTAIFLIFFGLNLLSIFSGGNTRVSDIGIFSPTDKWQSLADRQFEARTLGLPAIVERVFNNKLTFVANSFYKDFLGYFSLEFLFSKGASEATYGMIPGRGVLYLFELPLILFAIWQILKNKDKKMLLILVLLLLAPLPAAIAKGERAGGRAGTMLPFVQIISAYGAVWLMSWIKTNFKNRYLLAKALFFVVVTLFLVFFLEDYFYHSPVQTAPAMSYGWKEAMEYISSTEDKYEKILISRRFSEPQVAIAFYKKWNPVNFQEQSIDWLVYEQLGYKFVDQLPSYNLGKYFIRNFQFPEDIKMEKTLFIGKDEDFWPVNSEKNGKVLKVIYYPGFEKKIAFKIVTFE